MALKTLGLFVVFEAATFLLAFIVFSIPARKLVVLFILYLVPGVVVVPLIFTARRYFDRPRKCAVWFAIAMSMFCLLVIIATVYSGILLGLAHRNAARRIPLVAAFGCTIAGLTAYYQTIHRLAVKRH
jgi:hypothetical protein